MKILEVWELFASLDLAHFQLLRLRVENLASAPTSPEQGWVYFDTTLDQFRGWDGTEWLNLGRAQMTFGPVETQTTFGSAAVTGVSGNAARADHKHGTPAHDAAAHAAIKLSDLTAPTASVAFGNQRITGLGSPVADTDAATKAYADSLTYGLDMHESVDLVAVGITDLSGEQVIDGVTTNSSRVLVAQFTGVDIYQPRLHGIYTTGAGAWVRDTDADADEELRAGSIVYVLDGKEYGKTMMYCYKTTDDSDVIVTDWEVDVDGTHWTRFSSPQDIQVGAGLSRTGNRIDVVTEAASGIDLASGLVKADFTVLPRKIVETIGDGIETDFEIALGFAGIVPADAIVQVYEIATGETVAVKVVRGTSSIFVNFDAAPDADSMRVVIHV